MPLCVECGRHLLHADEKPSQPAAERAEPLVSVARFRSAAEAGYFADQLARRADLTVEVDVRDRCDSHAGWFAEFALLVPAPAAGQAAQLLRTLAAETVDAEAAEEPADAGSVGLVSRMWLPLVLSLAAGSLACWGILRAEQRNRAPALVHQDRVQQDRRAAADVLGDRAWLQKLETGTRELTFDARRRLLRVREDRDGDGDFDREFELPWGR